MINVIKVILQSLMEQYKNFTAAQKAAAFATLTAATAFTAYQTVKPSVNTRSEPSTNTPELEEVYTQDNPEMEREIATTDSDTDSEKQCKAKNLPSFINMSIGWRGSLVEEGLKYISPPSILVIAAGNSHPAPVSEEKVSLSKNLNAILVGNLSQEGKKTDSSSEHEEVHIVAPSDYYLTTADNNGAYQRFSGTSGATPLVTGSLAAFEWLSGYHPTAEEAKLLLKNTAIPTLNSNESPQKNGAGMVNAYKLGMVGKKLKELCGEDESCFKSKIQDPSTYEFPEDSDVLQVVDQAFPECSVNHCSDRFNICVDKASAIKKLRKAAFLNPYDKELWKQLACIYKSNGFTQDAKGAMSFYKALFGPDRNDVSAYSFCSVNSDCTLIPSSCSASDNSLSAVTQADAEIYYVERCEQTRRCNNKCRCDSSEDIPSSTQGFSDYYISRCVNSRCVSSKETRTTPQSDDGSSGTHTE